MWYVKVYDVSIAKVVKCYGPMSEAAAHAKAYMLKPKHGRGHRSTLIISVFRK